jgi:IS5 family transposase
MPDWVANKTARLERIRAAKATLEAEAKKPPPQDDEGPGPSSGMMKSGKPDRGPDGGPPDRAQRNFTDPDSRIQPTRSGGVIAGYNAQIAVDGAHQIIVAQRLQTSPTDVRALAPLLTDVRAVLRTNPKEVSADAGYYDEKNLAHLARRRIAGYLAPGRARHSQTHAAGPRRWPKGSRKAAMATKLKRAGRRSRYRLRKQIVEPVFGQIKHARGFRQFLLRGLDKVRAEWAMICTVHNLLKLANATG